MDIFGGQPLVISSMAAKSCIYGWCFHIRSSIFLVIFHCNLWLATGAIPIFSPIKYPPKWWDVMWICVEYSHCVVDYFGVTPPLLLKKSTYKRLGLCCWKHDQKLEKNLWSSAIFPQSYPPRASKWCCKKFLTARPVLYSCSIPRPGLRSAIMSIYETMDDLS